MINKIIDRLMRIKSCHLLWISVLASEIFTAIIVSLMSIAFHGRVTNDYLITGSVAALLVSFIVVFVLLSLLTKLNKLAETLRKSEANLNRAQAVAHIGSWRLDIPRNTLTWSAETYRMFGVPPEMPLTYDIFHAFVHPDDREYVDRSWQTAMRGAPYDIEHRIIVDGQVGWVRERAEVDFDADGNALYCVGTVQDVTERKKTEELIKNIEEQLRQSQKMEAVGQLAGGIAHDFNNMLNVIIGYGGLMQMSMKPDDPQMAKLKEILAAGDRAAHLTQSLLAFSRKQIISLKPIDMNKIIRKVERLLQRVIGADIEFSVVLSDKELYVLADAGQIEQVLINLATNARDAMPEGGDLIIGTELVKMDESFIIAHGYGKPGKYALISVSDTGRGMDEKTRLRIFEPFFTTKEVGKGTGLGLSIIYGIVKQHDGYINVYCEPGKGTTFKTYLPITKDRVEEKMPAESFTETSGAETILVAEDNDSVRTLTKSVLEQSGYTVIEAVDGEDAVNKFRENKDKIELLLLDFIMPKMDGKAAYDQMAKTSPDLKVIFTSGYAQEYVSKKGIFGKETEFICKPVSPIELLRKVKEVIGK